jgi:hypothetical protein
MPRWALLFLVGLPASAQAPPPKLVYSPLPPCRVADTRAAAAGMLQPGAPRTFHVVGASSDFAVQGGVAGGCGLPGFAAGSPQVRAVVLNLVAVNPQGAGNLRAWAADQAVPAASVLNYAQVPGLNIANAVVVSLRQDSEGQDLSLRVDQAASHVVIDVLGYFEPLALAAADLPVVPIARGGTGSTVQSFVDLSTSQTVAGAKSFSDDTAVGGDLAVAGAVSSGTGYVQPGNGGERLKIIRGGLTHLGDAFMGTGYTAARVGEGQFQISFNSPFVGYPAVHVTPFGLPALARLVGIGQEFVIVQMTTLAGDPYDTPFHFMAVGQPLP